MGSEKEWQLAQNALARALVKKEIPYTEAQGEAVFYGPKIDLNIVDAAGREWQCTTIQFDFNLPKRLRANYVGDDNKTHQVVMIHRALMGSVERFFAILLEHHSGNLPTWLAPQQVSVVPVGSDQIAYAKSVCDRLRALGVRAELDENSSTVSYRIRQAELAKIPYMVICGKHEAERDTLSVRKHGTGNIGELSFEQFLEKVKDELQ
jgi:threonyl-tRNA synthetase